MAAIYGLVISNWNAIIIPVAVFVFSLIALLWLRKLALDVIFRWAKKTSWEADDVLVPSLRWPFLLLGVTISIYLGLAVSTLPEKWKGLSVSSLWTLLTIALIVAILSLGNTLIIFFGQRYKIPRRGTLITRNVFWVLALMIGVLAIMDIWGLPTSPLLLAFIVLLLVAIIVFRDIGPNLFASFQIAATQEIKTGDFIKLDSGEQGQVISVSWNVTRIQALDGSSVIIPNNQLIRRKLTNYGRPTKRASNAFYFNTRAHMAELTGLKAKNLRELVDTLKNMPDEVIHYHTHHFLEEHQYLIPELSNDFAIWVKDTLGNEILAERLASINTFEFKSLTALRDRIVGVIEEYLSQDGFSRQAAAGREFHFMKSMLVVLPTPYVAHDIREFVEALRKISPSSLYFHIFESRLRLGIELNDFATWFEEDMGENELGRQLARIDPYTYTLEGLRSLLIQIIEKHAR